MAERQISLEIHRAAALARRGRDDGRSGAPVPVVLITYATTEAAIRAALDAVLADGLYCRDLRRLIRIERNEATT